MFTSMKNDGATDAWGRSMQLTLDLAEQLATTHGRPVAVGRLYVSAHRWIWGERLDDVEARTLDDGARWEPVVVALNAR